MPIRAASLKRSPIRAAPSSMEYSVCTWRCTKFWSLRGAASVDIVDESKPPRGHSSACRLGCRAVRANRSGARGVEGASGRHHGAEARSSVGTEAAIDTSDEAAVLARVRAGDASAYAVLVTLHAPIAKRLAVLSGAGSEADDVVQEAFVKAYQALPRFHEGAGFRPWLLRIVVNETRNLQRGRSRRALLELPEAETAGTLDIPPGTVKSRLHRALRSLREVMADA